MKQELKDEIIEVIVYFILGTIAVTSYFYYIGAFEYEGYI